MSVGEAAVRPVSSDSFPVAAKLNSCVASGTDGEKTLQSEPNSLNSSVSSEVSQASSISSSVSSVSGSVKESSKQRERAMSGAARKVAGKIPKPVSK